MTAITADELANLQKLNPNTKIHHCQDAALHPFGHVLKGWDFSSLLKYTEMNAVLPEKVAYQGSIAAMENLVIKDRIEKYLFGQMPIQIGWCIGHNSHLNGMEYHKSSEILIAVSNLMLFLGKVQDINDHRYPSHLAQLFFIPAYSAIELYASTLHLAPLQTSSKGFMAIIILPKHTNEPLSFYPENPDSPANSKTLFARNKWLLAHADAPAAKRGAWVGIQGDNRRISYEF